MMDAVFDNVDLSRKIERWLHEMPYRARAPVLIRPDEQPPGMLCASYVVAPGWREWFFMSELDRDQFVVRYKHAGARVFP